MLQIKSFAFGPFAENTYILFNDEKTAWLFDPGNSNPAETAQLENFIRENNLKISKILLTHAHIDHILGLQWAVDLFRLPVHLHPNEKEVLDMLPMSGNRFGLTLKPINAELQFLNDGDVIDFDGEKFRILFVPGHSPGSIAFYSEKENFVISGDVLFEGSIGRTDLYKGNTEQLLYSIRTKLFTLPEETKVFSGHGNPTQIGFEKEYNPFLN